MYYVGLDVHYRTSTYCILNHHGREVKCETVRGHWPKLLERLAMIKGAWTICFEATCGYGYLHRELSGMARISPVPGFHGGKPGAFLNLYVLFCIIVVWIQCRGNDRPDDGVGYSSFTRDSYEESSVHRSTL